METTNTITIPRRVYREIRWYLFNYNKLDDYIKKREEYLKKEVFDYYHFTNKNSLKNISSYGYTLDNCIIALEEDILINRYKKWKKLIMKYVNDVDNENYYIDYWLVKYIFFDKRKIGFIKEHLNLEYDDIKQEVFFIIYEIYRRAIKEKLYKEVA